MDAGVFRPEMVKQDLRDPGALVPAQVEWVQAGAGGGVSVAFDGFVVVHAGGE